MEGTPILLLTMSGALLVLHFGHDYLSGALRAIRLIHSLNGARVAQQIARLVLVIGLVYLGSLTVQAALFTELVGLAAAVIVLLIVFSGQKQLHPVFKNSTPLILRIAGYGFLYQVYSLLWQAHMKLDVILLKAWAGAEQAGLYAAAVNLSDVISRLPLMIIFVTTPYLAQIREDKESLDYAAKVCRLCMPIYLAGALILCFIAPWLVVLLFGESFSGSAAPLQIILPMRISSGLYMLLASFLVVKGYFGPLLVIQGFSLAGNLGLNAFLIPFLGADGAACGATCSNTLGLFTLIYYLGSAHGLRVRDVLLPRSHETKAVLHGILSSKTVKS
jgi:O-antigen/teichoic acid export membrane protein